jgi:hypothetical protein
VSEDQRPGFMDEWRPFEWLERHGPQDLDEARAATEAVWRARARTEELQALDALTPFESALAQRAYRAGASAVISLIERYVGRAAQTVSADALRQVLEHAGGGMRFRRHLYTPTEKWTTPENVRAAELVAGARHQVELESKNATSEEGPSG